MKTRYGYVSNSSSSSFVIINWKELDESKKDMILNYKKHVLELWKSNNIPVSCECNPYIDESHPLNFGYADDEWKFMENDGILDGKACIDNFNFFKWMDYIGGIIYRDCGECYDWNE